MTVAIPEGYDIGQQVAWGLGGVGRSYVLGLKSRGKRAQSLGLRVEGSTFLGVYVGGSG